MESHKNNSTNFFKIHLLSDGLKKHFWDQKGFTLFELIIVLFFISALSAIAFPNFLEWNQNYRLRGDANKLFSTMQKSKMMAIRNNSNAVISFNAVANNYTAFIDNGGTTGIAGDRILNGDEDIIASETMSPFVIIHSVNFSFGSTTPGFTSRGLPLSSTMGNVVLRRANNTSRWYRIALSFAGNINLAISTNSTDGSNGTWN